MSCEEIKNQLQTYLDGELDATRRVEVENHLKGCPSCSAEQQEYQSLRAAITRPSLYFESPRGLEAKVRSAVRAASHAEAPRATRVWGWANWSKWLTPAAAVALVTVVSLHFLAQHWTEDRTVQEVVSAHVRSLMVDHLTDVASSDQHTVKPWFNGKLNFSPPVTDPAAEGFPLIGGRLDYVGDSPAAALVYQRRKHYINLFISPSDRSMTTKEKPQARRGYNLFHWHQGDMEYWAVSDLNQSDLQQFVQLVRGEAPSGAGR